jgi:predicted lipoprotein with Yx(FWY)xxD motif
MSARKIFVSSMPMLLVKGTRMKNITKAAIAAVMVTAFLAAGLAYADHHAVKIAKKEGIGSYLTDIKGMTLYYSKIDTAGKSACEGPCVENWPLYYRETVASKDGLAASDFAAITRPDGKKQTTYKGMPLYYFAKDKKPGDTLGQGVKDVWYVVNP